MGNKFTRNITGIKKIEDQGLETNNQNDLLSEVDGNVHVRTLDFYHEITNDVKNINGVDTTMQDNNKVTLPFYLGNYYYYNEGKHYYNYYFFGDVRGVMLCQSDGVAFVPTYSKDNNVTVYSLESKTPLQVTDVHYNGKHVSSIYEPHYLVTDYEITDVNNKNYLKGRELIATKKELSEAITKVLKDSKEYTDTELEKLRLTFEKVGEVE